jgi:hypothetical protein
MGIALMMDGYQTTWCNDPEDSHLYTRHHENLKSHNFLFITAFRLVLRPIQPHIQRVLMVLSMLIKLPGHEADYTLASSVEVKNAWSYTSIPNTSS